MGKRPFINLASYESENDYWLMRDWSLLGTTILKKDWKNFRIYKYKGDYSFTNSYSLNIKRKNMSSKYQIIWENELKNKNFPDRYTGLVKIDYKDLKKLKENFKQKEAKSY